MFFFASSVRQPTGEECFSPKFISRFSCFLLIQKQKKTGAIFEQGTDEVQSAFKFAMLNHNLNVTARRFELQAYVDVINTADAFKLSKLSKYNISLHIYRAFLLGSKTDTNAHIIFIIVRVKSNEHNELLFSTNESYFYFWCRRCAFAFSSLLYSMKFNILLSSLARLPAVVVVVILANNMLNMTLCRGAFSTRNEQKNYY